MIYIVIRKVNIMKAMTSSNIAFTGTKGKVKFIFVLH
jgi:hypothetical protein